MSRIIVITGTDTGVGKTLLTALLAAHLIPTGAKVAALKPICSGSRDDARLLQRALNNSLPLDTINPWHFRAPITPLLAARLEKRAVRLTEVLEHIRAVARSTPRPDYLLIEGAGGLLSPVGEGFSTREWIVRLQAGTLMVGVNRLGVVNQILLMLEALPAAVARKARIVLMSEARPDAASRTNVALLTEMTGGKQVTLLPHFKDVGDFAGMLAVARVGQALDQLLM